MAESKGLAALVGALSLDPSAALAALSGADSESVSDSHKNAKNTLLAAGQSTSTATDTSTSSSGASAVAANQAAAAAAAAALEGIVVDDSLTADVTEEMLEINAFDLLRSLERQARQLQAEADTIAAAAVAAQQQTASAEEDDDEDDDQDEEEAEQQRPQAAVSSSSMMSVSVPNLCVSTSVDSESRHSHHHTGGAEGGSSPSSAGSSGSSGSTPTAFLESFANVARRRH